MKKFTAAIHDAEEFAASLPLPNTPTGNESRARTVLAILEARREECGYTATEYAFLLDAEITQRRARLIK